MGVLNSAKLLIFTITLSVVALAICWHFTALRAAPRLPGIDWHEQGQTVLIAYRSNEGCGCMDTTSGYIFDAIEANRKVVIVGDGEQLKSLRQTYTSQTGISYVRYPLEKLPKPFQSPKTKAMLVNDGRLYRNIP